MYLVITSSRFPWLNNIDLSQQFHIKIARNFSIDIKHNAGVCVCLCACVYVYVCVCACMRRCLCIWVYVGMCVCLSVYVCMLLHACLHVDVCVWVLAWPCVCVCVHVCVCMWGDKAVHSGRRGTLLFYWLSVSKATDQCLWIGAEMQEVRFSARSLLSTFLILQWQEALGEREIEQWTKKWMKNSLKSKAECENKRTMEEIRMKNWREARECPSSLCGHYLA